METVTVMNKEEAVVKMKEQISKLQKAYDVVKAKLEEYEQAVYDGQKAVEEMNAQIVALREEMNNQTELAKAKDILAQIEELSKDVQLQESINAGMAKKYQDQMLMLVGNFVHEDTEAVSLFRETEKAVLLQMSMMTGEEDVKVMREFANTINTLFSYLGIAVRKAGLASNTDRVWHSEKIGSVHLSRVSLHTKTEQLYREMKDLFKYEGF